MIMLIALGEEYNYEVPVGVNYVLLSILLSTPDNL
jgi:hypothetical protein